MAEIIEEEKGSVREEKSSLVRWWEFYFVRYALGTIFGALIVNVLVKNVPSIPFPAGSVDEITKPGSLPILAAYGLAYCYLASAPILVFHAARFSMKNKGITRGFLTNLIVSAVLSVACFLWAVPKISSLVTCVLILSSIGAFSCLTIAQFIALRYCLNEPDKMWNFYCKLDEQRRIKKKRELIDSYRHLREHGNSFFIVFLELCLGLVIYTAGKVSFFPPEVLCSVNGKSPCDVSVIAMTQVAIILLIWIIPAATIWSAGCILEAKFAGWDPDEKSTSPAEIEEKNQARFSIVNYMKNLFKVQ